MHLLNNEHEISIPMIGIIRKFRNPKPAAIPMRFDSLVFKANERINGRDAHIILMKMNKYS